MKFDIKNRWTGSVIFTADDLRKFLDYNRETGVFTWREARGGAVGCGATAGAHDGRGYIQIKIQGRNYRAHRLAWLHVHGEWPSAQIDHANGNKADNRISNLRLATRSQNNANKRRLSNNTSGAKGVSWKGSARKWQAQIRVDGRLSHLGYFGSIYDAANAYRTAAAKHFGVFARFDACPMKRLAEAEAARTKTSTDATPK
jgi:hypothetical protein